MIIKLVQDHLRHEARSGFTLLDYLRRQGRDAHATFTAMAGQLGTNDLVPHHSGGNKFKAFARFAADLALLLAAMRTNFFSRLNPFDDRSKFLRDHWRA